MDQHARTPKRKRRRMQSTTPGSGSLGRRTPGSAGAEATIVWKDSPVDKQIRVSGTGKCVRSHGSRLPALVCGRLMAAGGGGAGWL